MNIKYDRSLLHFLKISIDAACPIIVTIIKSLISMKRQVIGRVQVYSYNIQTNMKSFSWSSINYSVEIK